MQKALKMPNGEAAGILHQRDFAEVCASSCSVRTWHVSVLSHHNKKITEYRYRQYKMLLTLKPLMWSGISLEAGVLYI